jgi:hypothetical protein
MFSVDFDVAEQELIKYSAFVRYLIKMETQCSNTSDIYRLPEGI